MIERINLSYLREASRCEGGRVVDEEHLQALIATAEAALTWRDAPSRKAGNRLLATLSRFGQ